jgi:hypothetical protein
VAAAYVLVSFAEVAIAEWLISKVGVLGALVICGQIL